MRGMRDRPLLFGSVALVVAASGFGMLGPVARLAYETGLEPMSFVAWRATFGFLAVAIVVAIQTRRGATFVNPATLRRGDALGLLAIAFLGVGVNVATFIAFDLTTIALVLLAFYTYPALVAVVAVGLGHERVDGPRLAALGLALGGMVLVVAGGLDSAPGAIAFNPLGVLLGLAAAVCQTAFVTVSRGRFTAVSPQQAMGWVLFVVATTTIGLAIVLGNALEVPLRDGRALGFAILAGVLGAGVPSVLLLTGIRAVGGTRSGILMLIEPLVGVTLAAILLHEALRPAQVVGGIAILGAAIVLQRDRQPDGQPQPAAFPVAEHV